MAQAVIDPKRFLAPSSPPFPPGSRALFCDRTGHIHMSAPHAPSSRLRARCQWVLGQYAQPRHAPPPGRTPPYLAVFITHILGTGSRRPAEAWAVPSPRAACSPCARRELTAATHGPCEPSRPGPRRSRGASDLARPYGLLGARNHLVGEYRSVRGRF